MGPHTQTATMAGRRQGKLWFTALQPARIARGLTLAQAALALDISVPFLNFLEHGKRDPSLKLAVKIAAFYGKDISELWVEVPQNDAS